MGKYKQVYDGDVLKIQAGEEWRICCCDCGLVHRLTLRPNKKTVFVTVIRDNQRTALTRRGKSTKDSIKVLQGKVK